jgi:23S rRNA pseudouridine1911/1915/1917 synthase
MSSGAALRTLTFDRGDAGQRIDRVLCRHLADLAPATRTRIQSWIEEGRLTINGRPAGRVSKRAAAGDIAVLTLPALPASRPAAAENVAIEILYEDEYLLAVSKPPGMVAHPTYRHDSGTLLNALLWRARHWPAGSRPSLVGRLDKLTSGLVVVAKTPAMHAALQRTLASDRTRKDYLAVVHGRVNRGRGVIDLTLIRDPGDRRRMVSGRTGGAESLTRFVRLGWTGSGAAGVSLLQCELVTGRTHQIRAHLEARGWPIVGDPVYGRRSRIHSGAAVRDAAVAAFDRQALHAWRITLPHPITGEMLTIEAPPPDDLWRLLTDCGLAAALIAAARRPPHGSAGTAAASRARRVRLS